jgi:hypothetical protein
LDTKKDGAVTGQASQPLIKSRLGMLMVEENNYDTNTITKRRKLIATRATGKLTEADYNKLLPLLTSMLKQYSKINWYFEMENFDGWELKGLWEEVKFDAKHANDFDKVAMVGEKKWEEWMTDLMKAFTSAEVRFFDSSQKEEAIEWIKS